MTDNEIIKALECCLHSGERCNKCELNGFHDCIALHPKDILDLINRLKAENESLKEAIKDLRHKMSYMTSPNTIGDRHEMGAW